VKFFVGVIVAVPLVVAYVAQMARWLRVLQREHYEPASMLRFLGRWSSPPLHSASAPRRRIKGRPFTLSLVLVIALVGAVALRGDVLLVPITAAYGVLCPWGLRIRGTTSRLQWTRRLRTVAVVATIIAIGISVVGLFSRAPYLGAVIVVWAVPPLLDVTTRLVHPFEERDAKKFVAQATKRLRDVAPRVVAITGSYGKTSTKNYLAQLIGGDLAVVASPRSFNNRAGLSRAINENLAPGTQVFIAEMGTYGPGEIRDLTSWCVPDIAVVTAIGPVHLERMKTLDVVERSKKEITELATTVVLNVDDERLKLWTNSLRTAGKRVIEVGSTNDSGDVRVILDNGDWTIVIAQQPATTHRAVAGVHATNLACAIGAALALDVPAGTIVERVGRLAPVEHRLNVTTAKSGVLVIDDTFNANPASARAALDLLASLPVAGRRVVITPGLVELGREQYGENFHLGQRVVAMGAELVVVSRTNVVALSAGYATGPRRFDTRELAVKWVRSTLHEGDAVLYLNDLPDHYP
jgi:UDP-N-acetylmuramoyl-tripeptide--D-alanyl-D-alanine ligase